MADESVELIVKLANRVTTGAMSLGAAREAVGANVGQDWTFEQARTLADEIVRLCEAGSRTAMVIVELAQMVLAPGVVKDESPHPAVPVQLAALRAVRAALQSDAEFDWYEYGRGVAAWLLRHARHWDDTDTLGRALQALGQVHLQPLLTHTRSMRLEGDTTLAAWYAQGRQAHAQTRSFPEIGHALALAVNEFSRAARHTTGEAKGRAIKGHVNARFQLEVMNPDPDLQSLGGLAQQGLALLPPVGNLVDVTFLMGMCDNAKLPVDQTLVEHILETPIESLVEAEGAVGVINAMINLALILESSDPGRALDTLIMADAALSANYDEGVKIRYHQTRIRVLIAHLCDVPLEVEGDPVELAHAIQPRAEAENWPTSRVAGAFLKIAHHSGTTNFEYEGLRLLDAIKPAMTEIEQAHRETLMQLHMTLWSGAAVNAWQQGAVSDALRHYANALRLALQNNYPDFATTQLNNLLGVAQHGGADEQLLSAGLLLELGVHIEVLLGEQAAQLVQTHVRFLVDAQLKRGEVNGNVFALTLQIAKSRRFAAAFRNRSAQVMQEQGQDAVLKQLEQTIDILRLQVSLEEETIVPGTGIDRDVRLLAMIRDSVPTQGQSLVEMLANLQHRYDRRVSQQLDWHAMSYDAHLTALSEVQDNLDPRTAVLQLFLTQVESGRALVAVLTDRSDTVAEVSVDDGSLFVEMPQSQLASDYAYAHYLDVFKVREAILTSSDEAARVELTQTLEIAGSAFLSDRLAQRLEELNARGVDHLVIVPHGPFHFMPSHLLTKRGRMLVEDFTVTTIPSMEMLQITDRPIDIKTGAAYGMSFQGGEPFGLSELKNAVNEVERVARALNTKPKVDADATEERFMEDLVKHNAVHIATHGALNLDAPFFQYLLLTPSATSDGMLHAHELLTHDLSHVELITLSACETLLGRTDAYDNPRGLAAALLLAGVKTIVGTLWEVRGDTSRAFFVTLYQGLMQGLSRRDAFRAAQNDVRKRFPEPSDWGAFFLIGEWS